MDIGNCKAPCIGLQTEEDYRETINGIKHILKGNISGLKKFLTDKMMQYSDELEFERAAEVKQKIDIISNYQST